MCSDSCVHLLYSYQHKTLTGLPLVGIPEKGKQNPQKDGPIGISNAGICTQAVGTVSIDQSEGLPAAALTLSLGRGAG